MTDRFVSYRVEGDQLLTIEDTLTGRTMPGTPDRMHALNPTPATENPAFRVARFDEWALTQAQIRGAA